MAAADLTQQRAGRLTLPVDLGVLPGDVGGAQDQAGVGVAAHDEQLARREHDRVAGLHDEVMRPVVGLPDEALLAAEHVGLVVHLGAAPGQGLGAVDTLRLARRGAPLAARARRNRWTHATPG